MRLSSTQLQHHRALWVKITTPLPQKPRITLPCSMVLGMLRATIIVFPLLSSARALGCAL